MHLVACLHPSVCVCVCLALLSELKIGVKGSHYWSKGFVCVHFVCNQGAYADNSDVVDQLDIYE